MSLKNILLNLILICLVCASIPAAARAWDFFPSEYPAQVRVCGQHAREADLQQNYIDVFLPVLLTEDSVLSGTREMLVFLNPKVVATDFSRDEENLGAGVRYLSAEAYSNNGFILGANIFYDSKYSANGIRYYQLGYGIELLTRWVDLRANSYHPLSGKKTIYTDYVFGERSLLRNVKVEEPLPGYDLEAGLRVPFISHLIETRIYGGTYWYNATIGRDISGRRARLEISPFPLLSLTAEVRDDNVFGNDLYLGCRVNIPFDIGRAAQRKNPFKGWGKYWDHDEDSNALRRRMSDPVVRDLDIVSVDKSTSEKLQDLIFVDNTNNSDSLEDGSASPPARYPGRSVQRSIIWRWRVDLCAPGRRHGVRLHRQLYPGQPVHPMGRGLSILGPGRQRISGY